MDVAYKFNSLKENIKKMEEKKWDSNVIITWESSRSGKLIIKPCKTAAANRC